MAQRIRRRLRAAKEEALLACDLFNEQRRGRALFAFLVHMELAWTNLLSAMAERDGRSEAQMAILIEAYLAKPGDPVRKNMDFFAGLRERVDRTFSLTQQKALLDLVSGKSQAYIRNFENLLSKEFPSEQTLADELRLPLFLSNLGGASRARVPKTITAYIEAFDRAVGESIASNPAYDFRIVLDAHAAVQSADVTEAEAPQPVPGAFLVVRDREVAVANHDRMKPGEVVRRIKQVHPVFTMEAHRLAWHYFNVRPTKSTDKIANSKTDQTYVVYDAVHDDYTYYDAWITKLLKELGSNPAAVIDKWKRAVRGTSAA